MQNLSEILRIDEKNRKKRISELGKPVYGDEKEEVLKALFYVAAGVIDYKRSWKHFCLKKVPGSLFSVDEQLEAYKSLGNTGSFEAYEFVNGSLMFSVEEIYSKYLTIDKKPMEFHSHLVTFPFVHGNLGISMQFKYSHLNPLSSARVSELKESYDHRIRHEIEEYLEHGDYTEMIKERIPSHRTHYSILLGSIRKLARSKLS
jgi:hypothetical protein